MNDPIDQLAAGAVDLGAQQIPITQQIITAPMQTEAVACDLDGPGVLELNFVVMQGGQPICHTYHVGAAGRESIKAAIAKLDGVGD